MSDESIPSAFLASGHLGAAARHLGRDLIGTAIGVYEITALLGVGGMGEVYRARDTKLGRDVAIKVLPATFIADADRLARFQREARLLASLNHPHIGAIHGVEDGGGVHALVLELVDGETLADRIIEAPLPVGEALGFARQIAEALEFAHDHGIIHRDLKPANIKVTPDGTVKVLDFGLAKIVQLPDTEVQSTAVSTEGMIIGTVAYMSPEQARGRPVDRKTDIWAFGCVLFEMLVGRPTFAGETVADTIAALLDREPDWRALPQQLSIPIRQLLRRCLEKDPKRRLQHIGDARLEIEDALRLPAGDHVVAEGRKPPARRFVRGLATGLAFGALVTAVAFALKSRATPHQSPDPASNTTEMRLQIVVPDSDVSSFAMSPDGRNLAVRGTADGSPRIWLRQMELDTARPLPGTDGGFYPFFSPDSRSIGFFAGGELKRIDIATGVVRTLASAPITRGGAWSRDGMIVFAPSTTGPLYRIPAVGGLPVEATDIHPPQQTSHRFPYFLPDGRHFLFFAAGAPDHQGVYVGSLDSTTTRRVLDADSAAVFASPDYVLFVRQGTLMAQRFSLSTMKPVDDPLPVAAQVAMRPGTIGAVALSSSSGPIAYRPSAEQRQLVWLDRFGRRAGTLGDPDSAQPAQIRLSPDGKTVAVHRMVRGNTDVWLIESSRGIAQRFTSDRGTDYNPIWSPDGGRVVFNSDRNGGLDDLYEKSIDGSAKETLLMSSSEFKNATDWSSDGRWILFTSQNLTTGSDVWVLPMAGDRKASVVIQTPFTDTGGRFSPDSRWIAYVSNESGRNEIYVQAFPGPGGRRTQISTNGGTFPQWRHDGRELFYLGSDNRVMGVPVTLGQSNASAGTPAALFAIPSGSEYDASGDGQHFLLNTITEAAPPITVLLNWTPGLKK
jgi:serine/threonine protein kinase/Tol biopolymer transport system component